MHQDQEEKIETLKRKIADLKSRFPAHSVKPAMIIELEDLEEDLDRLLREKEK